MVSADAPFFAVNITSFLKYSRKNLDKITPAWGWGRGRASPLLPPLAFKLAWHLGPVHVIRRAIHGQGAAALWEALRKVSHTLARALVEIVMLQAPEERHTGHALGCVRASLGVASVKRERIWLRAPLVSESHRMSPWRVGRSPLYRRSRQCYPCKGSLS